VTYTHPTLSLGGRRNSEYYATVLTGRITCLARPSVCLSVSNGLLSRKRKNCRKPKFV